MSEPLPGASTAGAAADASKTSDSGTPKTAPPASTQDVDDDARKAAAGFRGSARWIGATLAAVPAVTVLTTLLQPPEGTSFEALPLVLGVFLAAVGVLMGILALGSMNEPVAIEDDKLRDFDMRRVIEAVDPDYATVVWRVQATTRNVSVRANEAARLRGQAKQADASVKAAEADADRADALAKEKAPDDPLYQAAVARRRRLQEARGVAGEAIGLADAAESMLRRAIDARDDVLGIRKAVFALVASDTLSRRYRLIVGIVTGASLTVATGVALIVLASVLKDDNETTAANDAALSSLDTVRFTLTRAGRSLICNTRRPLTALKLTDDETAPLVITFPTRECPAKKFTLVLGARKSLGTIIEE